VPEATIALTPAAIAEDERLAKRPSLRPAARALAEARAPVLVYLGTRIVLLAIAVAVAAIEHHSLGSAIGHWDGVWYSRLALHGYPSHIVHGQSVLGFLPLFPALMWLLMQAGISSPVAAGALISGLGGLFATVLVQRLASGWWGEESGRRAAIFFCLFPGSVVFSMAYSEGLVIPLAAGCLLALERRRWLLAGVLAALATATAADAVVLVLVCAVSAALALSRPGFDHRRTRSSLAAPLLAACGIGAVALFLWRWTGTPFATVDAQHSGWQERLDPLALVHQGQLFASQLERFTGAHPTLDLSPLAAMLGAFVLVYGLVLLLRAPRLVSLEAIVWTVAIGGLAVLSEHVGPNARMLITAFPVVLVYGHRFRGRAYVALLGVSGTLLVAMSALTFTGHSLTP
jgi:hypothetical protein